MIKCVKCNGAGIIGKRCKCLGYIENCSDCQGDGTALEQCKKCKGLGVVENDRRGRINESHKYRKDGNEMQNTQELYKIIIALVAILIGSWSLFGFFVIRWVKSSDENFKELFERTRMPIKDIAIDIEKMKNRIYDNEFILREKAIMLDNHIEEHKKNG